MKKPLLPLSAEERERVLDSLSLDADLIPKNATPEEKRAAMEPQTPAVPAPAVKSGWKTTEFWLVTILLGVLAYALETILQMLPAILATPGLPVWVAPLGGILTLALGFLAKSVVGSYQRHRTELKLPPDPTLKG